MRPPAYWVRRAWARMVDIELMGNGYVDRLQQLYRRLAAQIEVDMLHLYRRYRDQGALTEDEAAALLREPVDRATWDMLARQIASVRDEERRRRLMAEMQSGSVRARLDRQQAMLLDLRARCAQLAQQELPLHTEAYRQTADEAYLRTVFDTLQEAGDWAGADPQTGEAPPVEAAPAAPAPTPAAPAPQAPPAIPRPELPPRYPLPQPAPLSRDTIDDLLAERWSGKTYSERIWANTDAMAEHLADIMQTNLATGRSWRRCLDDVQAYAAKPGQGARYAAERLLRTEQNYMANQMTLRAMRDMGAKYYRYIATLDAVTSEICQRHDGLRDPDTGKLYEVSKARAGENVPPLHPNCRSTIAAVIDGATVEGLQRAARDPVTGRTVMVPADMTYPQWAESLSEDQRKALRASSAKYRRLLYNTDGTMIVTDDWTGQAHPTIPAEYKPYAVIETVTGANRQKNRSIYGKNGRLRKQINAGNHNSPAGHPFGVHGEHAHDVIWKDGKIIERPFRELTEKERKEHADII